MEDLGIIAVNMVHTVTLMHRCWRMLLAKASVQEQYLYERGQEPYQSLAFWSLILQQNKYDKYLDNISKYSTFAPQ